MTALRAATAALLLPAALLLSGSAGLSADASTNGTKAAVQGHVLNSDGTGYTDFNLYLWLADPWWVYTDYTVTVTFVKRDPTPLDYALGLDWFTYTPPPPWDLDTGGFGWYSPWYTAPMGGGSGVYAVSVTVIWKLPDTTTDRQTIPPFLIGE